MALVLGTNPDAFGIWTPDDQQRIPWNIWLDAVAAAGYREVELGSFGYLPDDGARVSDELSGRGLSATTGYLGRLVPDPDRRDAIVATARKLSAWVAAAGGRFLLGIATMTRDASGRALAPRHLDDDDWRRLTRLVDEIGALVSAEFGLAFTFHPHIDTAVETPEQVERFLVDTGERVGLCLDTGQLAFRGTDPADLLRRWAGRVDYVHLRDLDPVATPAASADDAPFEIAARRGLFCDPGAGLVDLVGFTAAVAETGYQGPAIVERSLLGSTFEEASAAAVRAREYYESIGLVGG